MVDIVDAQGGKVIVHGDGTVEVLPLTPEDIAQQQADADAAAAVQAVRDAAETRATTFITDPDRTDFLNQLKTATLAQIEAFMRGKINADGVTNLATAQTCLKRIETALVILMKLIALDARR